MNEEQRTENEEIEFGDPFGDAIDFNFNPLGDRLYSDANTRVKDLKVRPLQHVLGGAMVEVMVLESRVIRYRDRLESGRNITVQHEFHQHQFITVDRRSLKMSDEIKAAA